MILKGKLHAETPLYRGNARKTLFTRDGDGTQRLVSLAGEVSGTAQSLMDAFIGKSRDGRNIGLLPRLWQRLYGITMPENLVSKVDCQLSKESYPRDHFFDMRMGIRLNEDRWAAEANANYKIETLFRNSVFDFTMIVNDGVLKSGDNQDRLYYLLQELREGRFWFGAGKSKGLGRVRLDIKLPFPVPQSPPKVSNEANHLRITFSFDSSNPVLVGWNWGKIDPNIPSFTAIEGKLLLEAIRDLPATIRERLEMVIGGPILSPDDWKSKFFEYLPRVIAVYLREKSRAEVEGLVFPAEAIKKLGKGKHPLSKKIIDRLMEIADRPFGSEKEANDALFEALGNKVNMAKRVFSIVKHEKRKKQEFDRQAWQEIAESLGLNIKIGQTLAEKMDNEDAMTAILAEECKKIVRPISVLIDRRVRLVQSDSWIDEEISRREAHRRIKEMLMSGEIDERQWNNPEHAPEGIKPSIWEEFLDAHKRVRFQHMLNARNLQKSIANDVNMIAYLKAYRNRTRQELAQPFNTDFRAGGKFNREISRKYGKPYDTIFMRMLAWSPSAKEQGQWEIYIPGSTIKGAFRKRATQVLKTIWGETDKTQNVIARLFGEQGRRGLVFFSDAYLVDPQNPDQSYCSVDGVRMNPRTAQPIEEAKADYLYAYGEDLAFRFSIDLQDIKESDLTTLSMLFHLIRDFQNGDIPFGGEKTNGMGWIKGKVDSLTWLTANANGIGKQIFTDIEYEPSGIWQKVELKGQSADRALANVKPLSATQKNILENIPRAPVGFVSHRQFGGYCGMLFLEANVLTPVSVAESGQPSFSIELDDGVVNGWDFFSFAPPEASKRASERTYALPAKSIKGMIRHIYSIASDSREPSAKLAELNPVDSLFGWIGQGQNQAISGRLSFSFAGFENPQLAWFKVPYPYGQWQFIEGNWKEVSGASVKMDVIDDRWRLFPHKPLAPAVQQIEDFSPDSVQASYFRAMLPSSRCRFTVRFWNLDRTELQRLVWSLVLEEKMAHKIGRAKYLGFGSVKVGLLDDSYLIDWNKRYANEGEWKIPLKAAEWIDPSVIKHHDELRNLLDVKYL